MKKQVIPRIALISRHFMHIRRLFQAFFCLTCILILFTISSCTKDKGVQDKSYEKENAGISNSELGTQGSPERSITEAQPHEKLGSSQNLLLKNSPPQLKKVKLMPEIFKPGDNFYIDAEATDPDGDEVTISYEWYKNGELVSTERRLNSPVKRGDKLVIKIKPFDGKDYGKVITLNREILNLPPVIVDHKEYHFDKNIFTYQVKASDPDGDTLTYSLKSGPSGMTINSSTGLIQWNVPTDFKGKVPVTVSVTDGHGGEALYSFEVTIGFEGR